jgi:hypothetical protein
VTSGGPIWRLRDGEEPRTAQKAEREQTDQNFPSRVSMRTPVLSVMASATGKLAPAMMSSIR